MISTVLKILAFPVVVAIVVGVLLDLAEREADQDARAEDDDARDRAEANLEDDRRFFFGES